jgi:SHS2 domain-containing protein
MKYIVTDHTADIGLHVFGKDPSELFSTAATALFEIMIGGEPLKSTQSLPLHVDGLDWPDLMVNWLREILYLWAGKELLVHVARILNIGPQMLDAEIFVAPYDSQRHTVNTEVKAVTYHQIKVTKCMSGWEAKIILDV